jgi:uncharacterized protein YkwD
LRITATLTKLVAAGAAAIAIAGLVPAGASAHHCGAAADRQLGWSNETSWAGNMYNTGVRYQAEDAVICLTNHERAARNLKPLAKDDKLTYAARAHSRDMVSRHYQSHTNPEGKEPKHRMLDAGYFQQAGCSSPCGHFGENIHPGVGAGSTPRAAVQGWMGSTDHRNNILNPYFTEIGVGVARGVWNNAAANPSGTYTQNFGSLG